MLDVERIYNINLGKIYSIGRHRERARKAVKLVRAFAARHMKTAEEKVVIGMDVNELIWQNGMQRPPRRLRLKMLKDKDGTVMVSLEVPVKAGAGKKEEKAVPKKAGGKAPAAKEAKKEVPAAPAAAAPAGQKA
ncbi:MAG: 50S ribosomal protein L31e [Candidatus Micrarchaeota archaeon]|nr:50S ribosomal protein L31e [Candidatus Micrarchaeota archaeon]